ncbi:FecR family protein [Olivibacter sp. XZL3]|uniref:FecR family protein n=1 Tax=Olivibacter sp. XZL3 TaxID=1735116 RepID=UPI00106569D3|nr:FecR family protein [Olivibacter sp. XZL3]
MDPALLSKFLKNDCTKEEIAEVTRYLKANPDVLEQLFPVEEWEQLVERENDQGPSYEEQKRALKKLLIQLDLKENNTRFYYAVAACIAFLLLAGVLYLFDHQKEGSIIASEAPTLTKKDAGYYIHEINAGNKVMELKASDGSIIALHPGGELRFAEDFSNLTSRDFELTGKASFHVAKDSKRPFVVHSQGITTTALGTAFIVHAPKRGKEVHITLLNGKIMVKDGADTKHTHYLEPGDELFVNSETHLARLNPPNNKQYKTQQAGSRGNLEETDSTLNFNNLALKEVLHFLENNYQLHIRYQEKDVSKHYYSGFFKKDADVAQKILADIGVLNDFTITKLKEEYILTTIK